MLKQKNNNKKNTSTNTSRHAGPMHQHAPVPQDVMHHF